MQKEQITDKEAICILIIFVIGNSLIIGVGAEAKNDAWIAAIVGIIMVIPMLFVFSRILSLFPGKDLFDILNITLGKVIGKIVSFFYILYAFHVGALVFRTFGEFMRIVALPETPMFVCIFCMGLTCIIAVKIGIEVLGRTCAYFIPLLFLILAVVQVLELSQLNMENIKPILGNGLMPVLKGGFGAFAFPFSQTVLFLGALSSLKTKKSPFKVYSLGILISGIIVVVITIRNVTILGNMCGSFYFPSYEAVSLVSVGDFIQRIEVSVSIIFVFGVFVKCSICLLVACKGIGKVFNLKDYRSIVIHTGLLMVYFSYTMYDNSMIMVYWAFKVYPYYSFPFQVILPIIIWILAEIKVRKYKLGI
jgi:spore germination protein KB